MKAFINILLGNQTPTDFAGYLFFALLGAALSLLIQANNRDPLSKSTPVAFDWKFFFTDNVKRIVTGLLLIYVFLRFLPELTGLQLSYFFALAIGIVNDKLAQYLKDHTNVLGQKKIEINSVN